MMRFANVLLATALLGACSSADSEAGPAGVTESEAEALDQAAEMIEQRRLPDGAVAGAGETASASKDTSKKGE